MSANVSMQCFFGPVASEPAGYHDSIDMSGWESFDPTLVNLQYMSQSIHLTVKALMTLIGVTLIIG